MANISIFKNETLNLVKCNDGFWLYDNTRRQNISMRAKTEQDAFIEALTYYQKRLSKVEQDFKILKNRVDDFVESFIEDED